MAKTKTRRRFGWTSPQRDPDIERLRSEVEKKIGEIEVLNALFLQAMKDHGWVVGT